MPRRIVLLLLVAALAVTLGFWTFTPAQSMPVVKFGGYWVILAGLAYFLVELVRSLRLDLGPEIRSWRTWIAPVAVAAAATVFLHIHERHEFKVVADEVVLQLTAKEMHFHREVAVVVRGYEYTGTFEPLVTYVDKRPLLFPLLLSLVHDFTGYRVGNAYVLNAMLSGVLMLLLLLLGRRIGGWGAGVAAVLLAATIPLVAQNACGSGFEVLNLVMILLTMWLGMRYGDRPEDDSRLGAFVLSGVMLAQVRYESALFILPIIAAVAYVWHRQREIRLPWSLLATPLLLVLCPLQLNVFKLSEAAWQLNDIAGADKPFSPRYFYDNVGHALNFFLCLDGTQPNSILVAVLGVLAVGFFVLVVYREHRAIFSSQPPIAVLVIFLGGLLVHTGMMLCYFWGHWDDVVIHRLSLPAHLLFIVTAILIWPRLVTPRWRWKFLCGVAFLYLLSFTVPSNAMHRYTNINYAARATNWLGGHIRSFGDKTAVAIDQNAGLQWFLYEKSSITPMAIAARPEALLYHFRNHSFAEFLLVQRLTPVPETGEHLPTLSDNFGESFELQTIEERAFAPFYYVRLSRITRINEEKFKAWAKYRKDHPVPITNGTPALNEKENDELLEWLRKLP